MPTRERGRPARTSLGTATLISSHQSTGNGVAKELSTKLHEERPRATKGFGAAFPSHPAWRGKGDVMRGFPRERGRPARTSLGTASLISSHQSTGNGVAKELSTKLHEERPRATKGFGAAFPSHPAWRGKGDVMRGFPRERGRPARTSLSTASLISSHQSTGNGVAKELSTKLHEERPRATKGFGAAFPSHPAWRGKGDVMRGFPRERGRPARTSLGTASPIAPTSIKRIVQMMFPVCTGPTMLK